MCQFIETIKLKDGNFFHLNYHQERVDRTFLKFFPSKAPYNLETILKSIQKPENGLYRCRIVYDSSTQKIEFIEQEEREIKTLKIVECNSIDYSYKYLNRELIQELAKQKQNYDDILIVKDGVVTDTSIANILFYDGIKWITPDSPLLPGTTRARLLKEGIIETTGIMVQEISNYLSFQVVNALIAFDKNRFCPVKNIRF